jgi:hypothetical protein
MLKISIKELNLELISKLFSLFLSSICIELDVLAGCECDFKPHTNF